MLVMNKKCFIDYNIQLKIIIKLENFNFVEFPMDKRKQTSPIGLLSGH